MLTQQQRDNIKIARKKAKGYTLITTKLIAISLANINNKLILFNNSMLNIIIKDLFHPYASTLLDEGELFSYQLP